METNRKRWGESVGPHFRSRDYDVAGFRKGRLSVHLLEIGQMGPVRGKSLLHVQCHFGMDTLSWARLGARVTGVDYSHEAVATARRLAVETGLGSRAKFVESNVYDMARNLRGKFDIVYTGKGALCWLPDLRSWGKLVSRFLKPGGRFYLLESHPFGDLYEDDLPEWRQKYAYFRERPIRDEYDESYATEGTKLRNRVSYGWLHPVSEVLGSLIDAGLEVEEIREFPFTYWKMLPKMRLGRDGWWHLPKDEGRVPLMWSVRARKVAR